MHMTAAARQAVEGADIVLGYRTYLCLIEDLAPGVARESSGMGYEVERANRAVDLALAGQRVALVSSGDAGIYGMAGLLYEVLETRNEDVTVEVMPGVSALNAAASLLGAPLMTDFAAISLSDHLVSRETILRRLDLAARADFVICLYNPKGRQRVEPFERACEILARHRSPGTPVGIARAAYRPGQRVDLITLVELPQAEVDMLTVVVVGNSSTIVSNGKMLTPRGYDRKYTLDGA